MSEQALEDTCLGEQVAGGHMDRGMNESSVGKGEDHHLLVLSIRGLGHFM
jgi:hypothetical protein